MLGALLLLLFVYINNYYLVNLISFCRLPTVLRQILTKNTYYEIKL